MRMMLRRHGLEDKRDYTLIETVFPNMKPELLDHKVDLAALVPPFSFDPQINSVAHVLFTQKEAMGGPSQLLINVARAGFIAKNRAALVDYFEDNLRQIRWYLDPAHHDEVLKIVTAFTKTPRDALGGLGLHAAGRLSQPGRQARSRRAAGQHRSCARAGLHPHGARSAQLRRSEPRRGSGQAPQMTQHLARVRGHPTRSISACAAAGARSFAPEMK